MKQDFELISAQASTETETVGGKAQQLGRLCSLMEVPDFFVISTMAYDYFEANGQLPAGLVDAVMAQVARWGMASVALRSSVNCEDGARDSFAGVFDTFLHVPLAQIEEKIQLIYRSVSSERVLAYCGQKKIAARLRMAIVVQRMVQAKSAGVAFSRAPVAPTADVIIEASFGLGEGIVAGKVAVDHWRVSRLGEILDEEIRQKEARMVALPNGGISLDSVPVGEQWKPALERSELDELWRLVLRLEKSFGHPVDVEWALEQGKIFVLQLRPITREFPPLASFVDTNLAESYPGVSSPFTISFVKIAYRNVFTEAAVLLGAGGPRLARLMPHFSSLIGEAGSHLYYHLESYYAMLASMPGGRKNIENWHRMIGGEHPVLSVVVTPDAASMGDTFKGVCRIIAFTATIDRVLGRFCETLDSKEQQILQNLADSQTAEESVKVIASAMNRPIGFGLQLLTDIVIMMGLRPLTRLLESHGVPENQLADFLKTNREIESLRPLIVLQKIVNGIPTDFWPAWESALQANNEWEGYRSIWSSLKGQGWELEVEALGKFLDEFGDRSFEELKLESQTFRQSPQAFGGMLNFLRSTPASLSENTTTPVLGLSSWSWFDRLQWRFYSNITQKAIFWREKTRLKRGRFYNLIREGVLQIAAQLRAENPILLPMTKQDFFSIKLEEYEAFARGEKSAADLKEIMVKRSEWRTMKREFPEFLIIGKNEVPFNNRTVPRAAPGVLQGRCASSGEVEGCPLVIDDPRDALKLADLSDRILVTRHTDPAWVYIMARCKGLISEKGSLLSHTAIIGRELGIPTVVGVKNATKALAGVNRITLKADSGEIIVHAD